MERGDLQNITHAQIEHRITEYSVGHETKEELETEAENSK